MALDDAPPVGPASAGGKGTAESKGDVRLAVLLAMAMFVLVVDTSLMINEEARPVALQIALLVPLVAALLGLLTSFLMTRLPDPKPSAAAETLLAG